ncbi:hypothetical protein TBLA_0H02030 [Henningerozyma blattae CBS 6284]|uniref:ER membrane protein complex subunit 6 n=1 Tax=Henningerozyma blattae (strain ATCC 34711 / CBS 6284 / DSM 70876 / NBRC 10599 / NRRL Y-10934 / UCD 77-7) TaxID=1071380 RepID=I2H7Y7_HENB6|nr:hypothetical protein TBLA_0H02030 [Tetrapisispora blattae CBS 6284]CCH62489.1 hypothetical protein TBLA_0H02030 [Tetrapisispora blattae CBS 6284]
MSEDMFSQVKSSTNIQINKQRLLYVQDITTLLFGLGSGILQLESLQGFAMFFIGFCFINLLYIGILCKFQPVKYYVNPLQEIFMDNFVRELTGYVMSWTFSYAIVG